MPTSSSATMSDYLENKIINHLFRNITFTSSSSLWLALYTSDPTDDNTGTEVTTSGGTNYSRIITFQKNSGTDVSGSAGPAFEISNMGGSYGIDLVAYEFPRDAIVAENIYYDFLQYNGVPSGKTWGTVTHWGLLDANTTGNLLFYGALSSGSGITTPLENFRIEIGKLAIWFTGGAFCGDISGSLLNHILNGISYPSPTSLYAGLFLTPSSGGGTTATGIHLYTPILPIEVSASAGYNRVELAGAGAWYAPTNGSTANSASLVFSEDALSDWGIVGGIGIFTGSSGGSPILYEFLENSKTVYQGDSFSMPIGALKVLIY